MYVYVCIHYIESEKKLHTGLTWRNSFELNVMLYIERF